MLNSVVLVGRLTENPEVKVCDSGKNVTSVVVAVQRTFKNMEGLYETDFIRCTLWNNMATNTAEYCKCGDIVGIKGRIQTNSYEAEDGSKRSVTEVIAEKITFLSTKETKTKEKETKKSKAVN